jgi:hypothetical protein
VEGKRRRSDATVRWWNEAISGCGPRRGPKVGEIWLEINLLCGLLTAFHEVVYPGKV